MSAEETRARILDCTIELIKERDGDISNVTIRMIADRAGVGVGLTNHYFKSKDTLIAECVESVFRDIFLAFEYSGSEPDPIFGKVNDNPTETAKRAARNIMSFLLENAAIARVAVQTDFFCPSGEDYFTRLTNALAYAMVDRNKVEAMLSNDRISEKMKQQFREHFVSEQRRKAFMIISSLKEAFMRMRVLHEIIGVDLMNPGQREEYVDELVEMLM